jgi:hypothetical protein
MTIFGAVFYQGESDCGKGPAARYSCNFPAMIEDWRKQWHSMSGTDPAFPFGFVQVGHSYSTHVKHTITLTSNILIYIDWTTVGRTSN